MKPVFIQQRALCQCGHAWLCHLPYNVHVRLWTAHVKALACPKCQSGYRQISLGTVRAGSEHAVAAVRDAGP